MSVEKYKWIIDHPSPFIDEHSKNKHTAYADYLQRYIEKLTLDPRHPSFKLFIVDGFCGGGVYTDPNNGEHLGSPFIVFNAINKALSTAREGRKNPIVAKLYYYFVDTNKTTINYLQKAHTDREINTKTNYPIHYIHGQFASVYERIVKDIKNNTQRTQRAFFILDQYGWAEVPFEVINGISQQLSHAEFLLTFTPDAIIDYASADENKLAGMTKAFQKVGLDISPQKIAEIRNENQHPDKSIQRMVAQELLAQELKKKLQSKYFTRYQIKSVESHRNLFLVHLSQHPTAHNEMMEVHWGNSNRILNHEGIVGLSPWQLGYEYKHDTQPLLFEEDFFENKKGQFSKEMLLQLPKILEEYPNGLEFSELMDKLRNNAPVTDAIMREVVNQSIQYKHVDVINHTTGNTKFKCISSLHSKDLIRLVRQKFFSI